MNRIFKSLALGLALAASALTPVAAQDYPSRPIKLTIPFGTGGATDVLARMVGDELATRLGQPVVAENRPGASTGVAAEYVARARPDGYTLLFSTPTHALNAATSTNLRFDAVSDFEFVGKIGQVAFVLMASPKLGVSDVQGLVNLARAEPGKLRYGSSGTNSQGHLWTESFLLQAKMQALHVPYKGETQVLTDLLGGHIDFFLCTVTACGARMSDPSLKALAVTSAKRHAPAPQVPTIAEAGYPNAEVTWWAFMAAPKGTPAPVISKLNAALNDLLADEKFRKRLQASGIDPESRTTPAALRSLVQSELERSRAAFVKTGATAAN